MNSNMTSTSTSTSKLSFPSLENSSAMIKPTDGSKKFLGLSLTGWIILIIVLAILGINVFLVIGKGTQNISQTLKPYIDGFLGLFGKTIEQGVDTAGTGTKAGVDIVTGTVDTGVDVISGQNASAIQGASASSSVTSPENTPNNSVPQQNQKQQDMLNATLNNSTSELSDPYSYNADDSSSSIQQYHKTTGKVGWCFIGEERGYRSCSQVGEKDICMSGDIFPSKDICVNPSLRP